MDNSSIPSPSHDTESLLYLVCQLKQSYPIWSEIRSNISTIWLLLILSILLAHHGRINNHIHTITYCLAAFQHSSSLINLGIRCHHIRQSIHLPFELRCRCYPIWYTYCIVICRHLLWSIASCCIVYAYEVDKPTRHGMSYAYRSKLLFCNLQLQLTNKQSVSTLDHSVVYKWIRDINHAHTWDLFKLILFLLLLIRLWSTLAT